MIDKKFDMIYSECQPATLLAQVFRHNGYEKGGRVDIAPSNEFLQCSALDMQRDKQLRVHRHISVEKTINITQECWIVMKGSLEVTWYDINNKPLPGRILEEGDMCITFRGGHTFKVLLDNTRVYEVKTGPYFGDDTEDIF